MVERGRGSRRVREAAGSERLGNDHPVLRSKPRELLGWTPWKLARSSGCPQRSFAGPSVDGEPTITLYQVALIRNALLDAGVVFTTDAPRANLRDPVLRATSADDLGGAYVAGEDGARHYVRRDLVSGRQSLVRASC
jgi:hypothetical protein